MTTPDLGGEAMRFPDRRTVNVLLTILLFVVVLAVVYIARTVLIVFCFAILFAYLINPVIQFLQRHSLFLKDLRGPHIAEAYVVLLIVVGLSVYAVLPKTVGHVSELLRDLPSLSDRLVTGEMATEMGRHYGWSDAETLRTKTFLVKHRSSIEKLMAVIEESATTGLGAIAVIPILAIFFLSGGQDLADRVIGLMATHNNRRSLDSLVAELNDVLRHYIRAKVILGGLSFAYTSIALLISGFPHALALGALAGALEFIPIAGWITAAVTIVTVGVLTHGHWIWIVVFLGVWRVLIDYWIAPQVFGHELEIHPLLAIFTLMVGAAVGGFAGVYLALPIAAVIRVVWRRLSSSRDERDDVLPSAVLARGQAAVP
jgi:predicted PurR-regulated permease PerM